MTEALNMLRSVYIERFLAGVRDYHPPSKFSIVPIVIVWIMDRIGDGPIFSLLFWW